jgi:hypothetical protein
MKGYPTFSAARSTGCTTVFGRKRDKRSPTPAFSPERTVFSW